MLWKVATLLVDPNCTGACKGGGDIAVVVKGFEGVEVVAAKPVLVVFAGGGDAKGFAMLVVWPKPVVVAVLPKPEPPPVLPKPVVVPPLVFPNGDANVLVFIPCGCPNPDAAGA